ncbi:MAG: hypothetical protein K0Q97_1296 [Bacillota bacterium]|nr:hypothetical protein [Bacillota bacterium]
MHNKSLFYPFILLALQSTIKLQGIFNQLIIIQTRNYEHLVSLNKKISKLLTDFDIFLKNHIMENLFISISNRKLFK